MAFLKNDKLMMIGGLGSQIQQFLRQLLLKITSDLINSLAYVFWLKKLKNDIKIVLKPTGIKLLENCIKVYYAVYICKKKKKKRYGAIAE